MSSYYPSRLSPITRILLFAGYPVLSIKLFTVLGHGRPSIPEVLILLAAAIFLAMASASFLKSPGQFFQALFERFRYVFGLLAYLLYLGLNFIRIIFYVFTRSILWVVVLVVYWVSPIDIVPDPLLPLGILDDATLTFIAARWGVKMMNREMGRELSWRAKETLRATRIETSFP